MLDTLLKKRETDAEAVERRGGIREMDACMDTAFLAKGKMSMSAVF
jgi:hypothetical protein